MITTQKKDGDGKNEFEVECFIHLFNKCTQESFAVLSIIEDLLKNVKAEYPNISQAYVRSDNAGCYHNGALLLSLREVGERTLCETSAKCKQVAVKFGRKDWHQTKSVRFFRTVVWQGHM